LLTSGNGAMESIALMGGCGIEVLKTVGIGTRDAIIAMFLKNMLRET